MNKIKIAKQEVQKFLDKYLYKDVQMVRNEKDDLISGTIIGSEMKITEKSNIQEIINVQNTNNGSINFSFEVAISKDGASRKGWLFDNVGNDYILLTNIFARVRQKYEGSNFVVDYESVTENNISGIEYYLIEKERFLLWLSTVYNITYDNISNTIEEYHQGKRKEVTKLHDGISLRYFKNKDNKPLYICLSKPLTKRISTLNGFVTR